MNHKIEYHHFEDLEQRLQDLYQQKKYAEAYDLANRYRPLFPDKGALLDYWRLTMAARTGDYYGTLRLLKELQQAGFWYADMLLRKSPSFQTLQGRPDFEELAAINNRLQEQERRETYPLLLIRPTEQAASNVSAYPLLLALHANASTAQATVNFWRPAALQGWLIALPQSSQAMWKNAYSWNDRQLAQQETQKHVTHLLKQYPVDPGRIILAGHSMGGEVAIWLALTKSIPAQGFIAVGPGGPTMDNLDNWQEVLDEQPLPNLRGYLIIGDQDHSIPRENIYKFSDLLNQKGIACQVEVLAGVAHEYASAYDDALLRGLAFIENVIA